MAAAVPSTAEELNVRIAYVAPAEPAPLPLSLIEPVADDHGLMGARLAIGDNQTTGQFLEHNYELVEIIVPADADLAAAVGEALADGLEILVADLHADQLEAVAALDAAADAVILNVRATDDHLRTESCSANVFHIMPSRAMLADALAQYLVWKQWRRWFLVSGTSAPDLAFADAVRRSADRFGAEIVEERDYTYEPGARRTDSGHAQVQRQLPVFTQDAAEHDVLVVADEADVFGEYLPYRTWDPRPVAGTQGLRPTAWHRVHEQWGATQVQRRFDKLADRWMGPRDYTAWLAVRSLGEAVTRTGSADAKTLRDYLASDAFEIAGFKGEALTFRAWNQQMRQPVVLAGPRTLVSVSPQEPFLHQRTPLDTLGFDEPDSACRLN